MLYEDRSEFTVWVKDLNYGARGRSVGAATYLDFQVHGFSLNMTRDALIVVLSGMNLSLSYQMPSARRRNMMDAPCPNIGSAKRQRARMFDCSSV